jgi:hypothetical protein
MRAHLSSALLLSLTAALAGCEPGVGDLADEVAPAVAPPGFRCETDEAAMRRFEPPAPPDDQYRAPAEEKEALRAPPGEVLEEEALPAPDEGLLRRQAEYLEGVEALRAAHPDDPAAFEAARASWKQRLFASP